MKKVILFFVFATVHMFKFGQNSPNSIIIENSSTGKWEVNGGSIRAEMNPKKPADRLIINKDGTAGISTGSSDLTLNHITFTRKKPGSSILVEKIEGKMVSKKVID